MFVMTGRKRTTLPAVCTVAVQRLFIVIAAYADTAAVAVLIPVIIVLHMDVNPVDFTLCFGVVLLYVLPYISVSLLPTVSLIVAQLRTRGFRSTALVPVSA